VANKAQEQDEMDYAILYQVSEKCMTIGELVDALPQYTQEEISGALQRLRGQGHVRQQNTEPCNSEGACWEITDKGNMHMEVMSTRI
jgi:hypothetical protein